MVVCIESFDYFKDDVPCSFRVIFEIFSLAFGSKVVLPGSLCFSFHSLQVGSGLSEFLVVLIIGKVRVILVGMVSEFDVFEKGLFGLGEPVRAGFNF